MKGLLYQSITTNKKELKMKGTLYFVALSVSLIFTACSSNEQEILPLSPQLEKVTVNDINFPYQYLQSFDEIKDVKISYRQDKSGLTLMINTGSQIIPHMYAVIEQQSKLAPVLVFLGSSATQKYFIKGFNPLTRFSIKIYGGFKDETQLVGTIPYSPSTVFKIIPVRGWTASDPAIKVSSTKFPASLVHLFTELKTKTGSILVFLGKPENEDFEIPKYGELGIIDLNLFGYSEKMFDDN